MLVANLCEISCSLYFDEIDTEKFPLMIQRMEIGVRYKFVFYAIFAVALCDGAMSKSIIRLRHIKSSNNFQNLEKPNWYILYIIN